MTPVFLLPDGDIKETLRVSVDGRVYEVSAAQVMEDAQLWTTTLVKVAQRDAELVAHLRWALDLIDMYDKRMVQLGDPRERVYSAAHVQAKQETRLLVAAREGVDHA